jgi:HicB family
MSLVVEGLRADVEAVAELGDETVVEVAERIGAVLTRSAPSRLLDLLSQVAAELSDELPDGRVEIRLMGDDVGLAYVGEQPPPVEGETDLSARISLRLSDSLKARVESAASRQALSVNSFIVRSLERAVTAGPSGRGGRSNRLHGFGTS